MSLSFHRGSNSTHPVMSLSFHRGSNSTHPVMSLSFYSTCPVMLLSSEVAGEIVEVTGE